MIFRSPNGRYLQILHISILSHYFQRFIYFYKHIFTRSDELVTSLMCSNWMNIPEITVDCLDPMKKFALSAKRVLNVKFTLRLEHNQVRSFKQQFKSGLAWEYWSLFITQWIHCFSVAIKFRWTMSYQEVGILQIKWKHLNYIWQNTVHEMASSSL